MLEQIKSEISEIIFQNNVEILENFSNESSSKYNSIQIYSLIHNLLTNAIKYRGPDISLIIELKSEYIKGRMLISIKDNGLGFDLKSGQNKIFKLFQRMHTHLDGMGMGLYIVKSIVYSNGGFIEVFSESKKGTTFNLYL